MIRKFIPNYTTCKEFTRLNTGHKMRVQIRLFSNSDGTDLLYKVKSDGGQSDKEHWVFAGMVLGMWLREENPGHLKEPEYPYVYFEDMGDCPFWVTQYKLYPLLYEDGMRFYQNDLGRKSYLMIHHKTTWIPESEVALID